MNFYYKVQTELIKNYDSIDKLLWCEDSECVFYSANGFVGYYIPKQLFLIDTRKLSEKYSPFVNFDLFTNRKDDEGYKRATITGTKKIEEHDFAIFTDKEGREVLANVKFLKAFPKECTFDIKGKHDMIRVYLGEELCGIVCPFNQKERK